MSEILSERIPLELEGTPVSSIMIEEPFTCTQDCTISDVVRMLAENEVSSMPVIDERNQVVGFISDGDVMGAIAQHRAHTIFTGGDASACTSTDQSFEQRHRRPEGSLRHGFRDAPGSVCPSRAEHRPRRRAAGEEEVQEASCG